MILCRRFSAHSSGPGSRSNVHRLLPTIQQLAQTALVEALEVTSDWAFALGLSKPCTREPQTRGSPIRLQGKGITILNWISEDREYCEGFQ